MCPCCSEKSYKSCCQIYHEGQLPPNALALMRSRYSAYAKGLSDYIIKTTHSDNPQYTTNIKEWNKQIDLFSQNTQFEKLEILDFTDGDETAFVTFKAHLKQNDQDATFSERSRFIKSGEQWLYLGGNIIS